MSIELDCTDIIEIFKTHLKIENSVKSISHTFLNERYINNSSLADNILTTKSQVAHII